MTRNWEIAGHVTVTVYRDEPVVEIRFFDAKERLLYRVTRTHREAVDLLDSLIGTKSIPKR